MAEVKWIKLTVDMFDNRKIKYLRTLPEGNNIVLIWVMLLTIAGRCNAGGMIFLTENVPYTPNILAEELGFDVNTVILAIEALEKLGMVSCDDDAFLITGWAEHQNVEGMERAKEMNRERQRQWYARQKTLPNGKPNVSLTLGITEPNAVEEELRIKNKKENGEIREKKEEGDIEDNNSPELQAAPVLTFLLNDGTEYPIDQEYIDQMQDLYPAVDVMQEMRSMKAWCLNNPKKRKTRRGIKAFVNNWLSSEQDRGGRKRQTQTQQRQSTTFMDIYERRMQQDDSRGHGENPDADPG